MNWYRATVGGDTTNAVANRSGLVGSTLDRQLKADSLRPESAVAIARAYGADPVDALVAVGLLTAEEVARRGSRVVLAELTDRMLADEVWDRMAEGRGVKEFDDQRPSFQVVDGGGVEEPEVSERSASIWSQVEAAHNEHMGGDERTRQREDTP